MMTEDQKTLMMSEAIKIKIYVAIDDTGMYKEANRYRGTYLHGELQDENRYDIFSFSEKLDLEEGIHKFSINNRPTTYFLWKADEYWADKDKWRGYLIYDTDEDYEWAKKQYEAKEQFI